MKRLEASSARVACGVACGAMCLAAALGFVVAKRGVSPSGASSRQEDVPAITQAAGSSAPLARPDAWLSGTVLRYALDMNIGTPAHDAAQARLTGTLRRSVLGRDGDLVDVELVIDDPRFVVPSPDGGAPSRDAAMERQLALPFVGSYDARGYLKKVHLSKRLSPGAEPLVRGILGGTQLALPEGQAPEWTSEELDATGLYLATYQKLAPGRYAKKKLRYLRVMGAHGLEKGGAASYTVHASDVLFTTSDDGQLQELSSREVTGVTMAQNGESQFDIEVRLSLKVLSRNMVRPELLASRAADLRSTDVALAPSGGAQDDDVRRQILAGGTYASLMGELAQLAPEAAKERAAVQTRLSALFGLEPSAIADAALAIRKGGPTADVLAAALGGADTAPTQRALVDLATDQKLGKAARETALTMLTIVEHPRPESREPLTRMAKEADPDVRVEAAFALGANARGTRESSPESSNAAASSLVDLYGHAQSEEDRVNALRAIGNAGHPATLETLRGALASASPAIRAAAAHALRFVEGEAADVLLARVMQADPSSDVRQAAVFAARYRDSHLVLEALTVVCHEEADAEVRRVAIDTLAKLARSGDEPIQLLHWLVDNESSADNRKAASEALQRVGS